jgi:hypothetical protein
MADYEVSGIIAVPFYVDSSGNLTTATPVDCKIAGAPTETTWKMPQKGCLRGIVASSETTPNTANPTLVCGLTVATVEVAGATAGIIVGATKKEVMFKNGAYNLEEGDEVGASIMQTGTTIDAAVNEVSITLLIQLGRSNI